MKNKLSVPECIFDDGGASNMRQFLGVVVGACAVIAVSVCVLMPQPYLSWLTASVGVVIVVGVLFWAVKPDYQKLLQMVVFGGFALLSLAAAALCLWVFLDSQGELVSSMSLIGAALAVCSAWACVIRALKPS